jgi:membrane-bound lytic murein transglycosylase B
MRALLALALAAAVVPIRVASFDFPPDRATSFRPFEQWLAELMTEARGRGYSEEVLAKTLGGVQPLPAVLEEDRAQPEVKLAFDAYVRRRLTPDAVRRGRELLTTHREVLDRVREAYGVPPSIVVAIWGLESHYGESPGEVPVFAALATLAWEGRRGAFFRSQLYDALAIVQRGDVDAPTMKGSWAGAMGQPQFMPSSYLAYAVDFDGDGRRDIWTSHADTFASIANFLRSSGWRRDGWGREVRAPTIVPHVVQELGSRTSGCRAIQDMTEARSLSDWRRLGFRRADGADLPAGDRHARLVRAGARQFLVHDNYDALLHYNCAHHYALSVAMLADRIRVSPAGRSP